MINPAIFLRKAEQLINVPSNKKGIKHNITLGDNGELFLNIAVQPNKNEFYSIQIDQNSNPEAILEKHKGAINDLINEKSKPNATKSGNFLSRFFQF